MIHDLDDDNPTARLYTLCKKANWNPDPAVVQQWVADGADVCCEMERNHRILTKLIESGKIECVKACLTTANPIDLTARNEWGTSALHYVASSSKAAALLNVILDRLESGGGDKVDWGLKNRDGDDFLSFSAAYGNLSSVWPTLRKRRVAFFMDALAEEGKKILITSKVRKLDWEDMKKDEREPLQLLRGIW